MKLKLSRPRFHTKHRKKLLISIALAVIGLIFATYAVLSYLAWQNIARYTSEAGSDLKAAIARDVGSSDPYTMPLIDRLATLGTYIDQKYGAQPCDTTILFNWQTVLPPLQSLRDDCNDKQVVIDTASEAIDRIHTYLLYEEKSYATLSTTLASVKTMGSDYQKMIDAWQTYQSNPNGDASQPPDDFSAIQERTLAISTTIVEQLNNLITADKNEDRDAFDDAISALNNAYASLQETVTSSELQHSSLVTSIVSAYKNLK